MMSDKVEIDFLNKYLTFHNLAKVRFVCKNISNSNCYAFIVNETSDDSLYAICLKLDEEYIGPCVVEMYEMCDNSLVKRDACDNDEIESIKRQLTRSPLDSVMITGNLVVSNVRNESFVCFTDGILDTSAKLYSFATMDGLNDGFYSKKYFVDVKRNMIKRFYDVINTEWKDEERNEENRRLIEKIKLLDNDNANQHVLLLQDSLESEILKGEREMYDNMLSNKKN